MAEDSKTHVAIKPKAAVAVKAQAGNQSTTEDESEVPINTDNPYGLDESKGDKAYYVVGAQIQDADGNVVGVAPKTVVPRSKMSSPMGMKRIAKHVNEDTSEDDEE